MLINVHESWLSPVTVTRLRLQHFSRSTGLLADDSQVAERAGLGVHLAARQADLRHSHRTGRQHRTRYAGPRRLGSSQLSCEGAWKEPIVDLTVSRPWRQPVGGPPTSEWFSHWLGTETLPCGHWSPRHKRAKTGEEGR